MRTKTSRVAVVIGHDKNSPGYYSPFLEMSEYAYNSELAMHLNCADIYKRPLASGYTHQMELLSQEINPLDYDIVIELHFNGFDNKANKKGHGCECVIYPGNKVTADFGNDLLVDLSNKYNIRNRGIKEHGKGMRGYGFLSLIESPTLIYEPFFGDEKEAMKFSDIKEHGQFLNEKILEFLER